LGPGGKSKSTPRSQYQLWGYDIDSAPDYLALSYCWGSPDRSATIDCNDTTLKISQSLCNGLKQLEQLPELSGKYIWIDQICVNQDDLAERSHQILLMDKIYSRARKVVVWLDGIGTEQSGGFQLAERIYNLTATRLDGVGLPIVDPDIVQDPTYYTLPDLAHPSWRELRDILSDPWFRRIWIIQEVFLATEDPMLVYGSKPQSWKAIIYAGAWISQAGASFCNAIKLTSTQAVALRFIQSICNTKERWELSGLLRQTAYALATDPRDKVFALFNLCSSVGQAQRISSTIVPNYTDSVVSIYTNVVKFTIKKERNLLLLSSVNREVPLGSLCGAHTMFPSWVPDFSTQHPVINHSFISPETGISTFNPRLNASKTEPIQVDLGGPQEQITLAGLRVDAVQWRTKSDDLRSWYQEAVAEQARVTTPKLPNPEYFIKDFIDAYSGAVGLETSRLEELKAYLEGEQPGRSPAAFPERLDVPLGGSHNGPENVVRALTSRLDDYRDFGTTFFATREGNMAVGPKHIQRGDVISVLFGGAAPFVLRQCSGHFHLIGECYIPFWMTGKAVEMRDEGGLKQEWFHLR
jgi:hypothetical protein